MSDSHAPPKSASCRNAVPKVVQPNSRRVTRSSTLAKEQHRIAPEHHLSSHQASPGSDIKAPAGPGPPQPAPTRTSSFASLLQQRPEYSLKPSTEYLDGTISYSKSPSGARTSGGASTQSQNVVAFACHPVLSSTLLHPVRPDEVHDPSVSFPSIFFNALPPPVHPAMSHYMPAFDRLVPLHQPCASPLPHTLPSLAVPGHHLGTNDDSILIDPALQEGDLSPGLLDNSSTTSPSSSTTLVGSPGSSQQHMLKGGHLSLSQYPEPFFDDDEAQHDCYLPSSDDASTAYPSSSSSKSSGDSPDTQVDTSSASEPAQKQTRALPPSLKQSPSHRRRKRRCDAQGENGQPVDADRRMYNCSECSRPFARPSALKTHSRSHSKEKPFTCPLESCGRSFGVFSNLKRHAKLHKELDLTKIGLKQFESLDASDLLAPEPHSSANLKRTPVTSSRNSDPT